MKMVHLMWTSGNRMGLREFDAFLWSVPMLCYVSNLQPLTQLCTGLTFTTSGSFTNRSQPPFGLRPATCGLSLCPGPFYLWWDFYYAQIKSCFHSFYLWSRVCSIISTYSLPHLKDMSTYFRVSSKNTRNTSPAFLSIFSTPANGSALLGPREMIKTSLPCSRACLTSRNAE